MYKISKQDEEHDGLFFQYPSFQILIFNIMYSISFVYLFYYTILLNNAEIK